jgi:hypothetical protein
VLERVREVTLILLSVTGRGGRSLWRTWSWYEREKPVSNTASIAYEESILCAFVNLFEPSGGSLRMLSKKSCAPPSTKSNANWYAKGRVRLEPCKRSASRVLKAHLVHHGIHLPR